MSDQNQDRRRDRRARVELWIEAEAEDELYYHRTANLSIGGAYFDKTVPAPLGKVVRLRFTLPRSEAAIACRGEIVSAQELGMGVKFLDLDDAGRQAIESLLDAFGETPPSAAR